MEILRQILQFLNDIPPEIYSSITEILIQAVAASAAGLALKRKLRLDDPKVREKIMVAFVMASSITAAGIGYILTVPEFAPWVILVTGGLTFATTRPVYYFFLKPLFTRIGAWFAGQVSKAAALNEAKAAAVPAEGLPISSKPNLIDDFSH